MRLRSVLLNIAKIFSLLSSSPFRRRPDLLLRSKPRTFRLG